MDQLHKYANRLSELNEQIKSIQKASSYILEEHIESSYIDKFVRALNASIYHIKSLESVAPSIFSDSYTVTLVADIYCKHESFDLLICYKDRTVNLFFETNGDPSNHEILEDFNIDDYKVLDDKDQSFLLDSRGEMLSEGTNVKFFIDTNLKQGTVIGFNDKTKNMIVSMGSETIEILSNKLLIDLNHI